MNRQSKFAVIAIVAALLIGTTSLSTTAFAGKPKDPNCWGDVTKDQAKSGTQGEHASDPLPNEPGRETPRHGIGNIGPDLGITGDSKHPSDLGEALGDCNP